MANGMRGLVFPIVRYLRAGGRGAQAMHALRLWSWTSRLLSEPIFDYLGA